MCEKIVSEVVSIFVCGHLYLWKNVHQFFNNWTPTKCHYMDRLFLSLEILEGLGKKRLRIESNAFLIRYVLLPYFGKTNH